MSGKKSFSLKKQRFNKKDSESSNDIQDKTKPKFDKKKWRERKYSNKFKVAKWEEQREKAVIKQYYKELKNDPLYSKNLSLPTKLVKTDSQSIDESSPGTSFNKNGRKKKLNSYQAACAELQRLKKEKLREKEERLKRKQEIKTHLEEYKKKRAEKYKILSQKTARGQPLLKGRLQLLYEQIKQSTS